MNFLFDIPLEHIDIILHCCKSILYHNGNVWLKTSKDGFGVLQGSFDGAEVSELMGLFILNKIIKIVHIDNHDLYRADGLIIVPDNRKANDKIRKMLFKLFHDLKFKVTVTMNKKIV